MTARGLRYYRHLVQLTDRLMQGRNWLFVLAIFAIAIMESIISARNASLAKGIHHIFDASAFGRIARKLVETGSFRDCYGDGGGFWDAYWGHMCFLTHRLPFVPSFLAGFSLISGKLLINYLIKNIIFFGISASAFVYARRAFNVPWLLILASATVYYLLPQNAKIAVSLDVEEGFIYHLMPWIFIILVAAGRNNSSLLSIALGLLLGTLLLTKSSVAIFCYSCLAVYVVCAIVDRRISLVVAPIVLVSAATIAWGSYTLIKTGRFAIGTANSSINGWNMYKGNNPHTSDYYLTGALDDLDYDGHTKVPMTFTNEWQVNYEYERMARDFIRNHPHETIRNVLERLYVAFVAIDDVPKIPTDRTRFSAIFMIVDRAILAIAFAVAAFKLFYSRFRSRHAWAFLIMYFTYQAPGIAGFVYQRHLIPLVALSLFFLMSQLAEHEGVPAPRRSG